MTFLIRITYQINGSIFITFSVCKGSNGKRKCNEETKNAKIGEIHQSAHSPRGELQCSLPEERESEFLQYLGEEI